MTSGPDIRPLQNAREIEALRLPMLDRFSRSQFVRAADHFVYVRKPSLAMISRNSAAMNRMKLTTWSGLPEKNLRSCGSWVATPTGQVVQMAHAHHQAAQRHERRGGKPEFLRPKQRGDGHVTARLSWPSARRKCGCGDY